MKRVLCDESPLALSEEKGVLSGKYWARYRIPDRPVSPEVQFRVSSGHQRSYRAARSVSENKAVDPYRHPVRLFCRFQHTGRKLPVPQVHPSNPRNSSVTQGESFAGSHKSPTPFVKEQPHARELSSQRTLFILHPEASISLFASSCYLYLLTPP